MQSPEELYQAFEKLKHDGMRLAGGLTDLRQRASVYHHLFAHSQGNHVFPVIAAHGALWARGYFEFGMKLGRLLSWQYGLAPARRQTQLQALAEFADVFREVNRRVCVDTYAMYHFTRRYGSHPAAYELVDFELLEALQRVHTARRSGQSLSDTERRNVFEAHFLNEQTHVVGPSLERAVGQFKWPVVKQLALRPLVRFAYFPEKTRFWFRNFAARDERIEKGMGAFDCAAAVGWEQVESSLADYQVIPRSYFQDSAVNFAAMRRSILATPCA